MFRRTFNFETFCNIALSAGNDDDWDWYPTNPNDDYSSVVIVNHSRDYSFELSDVEDTFISVKWWNHNVWDGALMWFWDVGRKIWVNSNDVQIIPNRLMNAIAEFLEEMCSRSHYIPFGEVDSLFPFEIDHDDLIFVGGPFSSRDDYYL